MTKIQQLCPSIATNIINCYREAVSLFIDEQVNLSSECITQEDLLSMNFYAMVVLLLIYHLDTHPCSQVGFANHSALGGGTICVKLALCSTAQCQLNMRVRVTRE